MNWQWTSINSMAGVSKADYEQLLPLDSHASPFLQYDFLHALETSECVCEESGWQPLHIIIKNSSNHTGDNVDSGIVAFIPAYIKTHSYGEYVFDHSWAHAYQQHGLAYYPKLIMAVPFTPVTGSRVLIAKDIDRNALLSYISAITSEILKSQQLSSLHMLFSPQSTSDTLALESMHQRQSVQFNWLNKAYSDYTQFTESLTARRRRSIKKERASIIKQGVNVKRIVGSDINAEDMQFFYRCYQQTYLKRSGHTGYLNQHFFYTLLSTMSDNLMLIIAEKNQRPIAAALFFHDKDGLYGRYWGALEDISGLHFEVCYYQGIEHCIENNIPLFNPGTQGEHKILRGFEPTLCYSNHIMTEPAFDSAVKDFLQRETPHIVDYFIQSQALLPFKQECEAN